MNKFLKDKINERLKHYDDLNVKLGLIEVLRDIMDTEFKEV